MGSDGPIVLSTFASLASHGYCMDAHCQRCERWTTIDPTAFPPSISPCSGVGDELRQGDGIARALEAFGCHQRGRFLGPLNPLRR
jgi:hypothetical protein